jgi:hypothetical protein
MNSRAKGKRGELEAALFLRQHGVEARRGQQFSGGTESPDVVSSIPNVHIEVKRVEKGNLHDWMEQAIHDAGSKMPVVMHRRNRSEWYGIIRMEDLLIWLKEIKL